MKQYKHLGAYGLIIKDDEILLIKKNGGPYNGKLDLPGGTIELGETSEEAALREIYEETGYKNISIQNVSNFRVINHFYAGYKGVNRYAYLNIVYGSLINNEKDEITKEEKQKHNVKWVHKNSLKDFINIELNKYALDILLNGEHAYESDGVMITNDYNNGKLNIDVRMDIINKYFNK